MSAGTYISGIGHTALIVWMVVGWGMSSEPLPFEITEVSVVSGEDFAAMTQGAQPELPPSEPAAIEQPPVDETPPAPEVETPPVVPEAPAPVEPPAVETPPAAPDLTVPETVVTDTPPDVPDTPQIITPPQSAELGSSLRPVPRPAPRVAPEIVAPPEPDATVAPEETTAASDQVEAPVEETTEPAEETTAPEAAADQIVTEAEEPSFAPEISSRPPSRPASVAAAAQEADQTAVDDALAAALAGETSTPAEPAPSSTPTAGLSGGQLSDGDKSGFLRQVGGCWNTGALSTGAQNTIIDMVFDMTPDGRPVTGSIQLDGFSGGNATDADAAFQAARRALIRCTGDSGYDLPQDQYDQWQRVVLTVDPTAMRQR
ncbi:cell envelope biogenesis protein TolA [Octadecabacter sp. 1_MG-2023]|uniref:cell envelope biogenesis protein TolA n=1 Tax=unclassified Octadecabacter TaxID=196158 RepID=UPI001C086CB9|nr:MULTISPECIES: cell envelope biogenesis protein TolA [unclassified Octadecabacter]MBU2991977.1 cell envelope biogenesis protein TolA [Octadecabacter sp. B2R22]MDO6735951.1 cell envelope biogenesis protein TolA [Octadecabacter sp. 1_MG-2023]